jgi:siroheme synthase-like protein
MPRYYPVFLDVKDRTCQVFGGNAEAERKVRYLLECGAQVAVFSPAGQMTAGLRQLAAGGKAAWTQRTYRHGDLAGAWLVIVADTSDAARNERIFAEARDRGIMLNTMDVPHLCTFIAPAIVQRHDVTVAVSTAGTSPALARKLREEISSDSCSCLRWADAGPLLAEARRDVRAAGTVVCPETWQEFMTPAWLERSAVAPEQARRSLVEGLAARHCEACAPYGRCQKHV